MQAGASVRRQSKREGWYGWQRERGCVNNDPERVYRLHKRRPGLPCQLGPSLSEHGPTNCIPATADKPAALAVYWQTSVPIEGLPVYVGYAMLFTHNSQATTREFQADVVLYQDYAQHNDPHDVTVVNERTFVFVWSTTLWSETSPRFLYIQLYYRALDAFSSGEPNFIGDVVAVDPDAQLNNDRIIYTLGVSLSKEGKMLGGALFVVCGVDFSSAHFAKVFVIDANATIVSPLNYVCNGWGSCIVSDTTSLWSGDIILSMLSDGVRYVVVLDHYGSIVVESTEISFYSNVNGPALLAGMNNGNLIVFCSNRTTIVENTGKPSIYEYTSVVRVLDSKFQLVRPIIELPQIFPGFISTKSLFTGIATTPAGDAAIVMQYSPSPQGVCAVYAAVLSVDGDMLSNWEPITPLDSVGASICGSPELDRPIDFLTETETAVTWREDEDDDNDVYSSTFSYASPV